MAAPRGRNGKRAHGIARTTQPPHLFRQRAAMAKAHGTDSDAKPGTTTGGSRTIQGAWRCGVRPAAPGGAAGRAIDRALRSELERAQVGEDRRDSGEKRGPDGDRAGREPEVRREIAHRPCALRLVFLSVDLLDLLPLVLRRALDEELLGD